ncbi:MAG TPA: DNA-binding protein WhiA, partial [Candidatus Wallbacteria bacterium]|nr:DNA-binding protein WhiA [Candidatus Wallbacteria bacterium]
RFGITVASIYKNIDNLSKKHFYCCTVDDPTACATILRDIFLKTSLFAEDPPPDNLIELLNNACCSGIFLRSMVITSGYFQDVNKSYHFEIRLSEPFLANIVKKTFKLRAGLALKTHILKAENTILLYSKSFDNLEKVLGFLKATGSHLKLEDVKILKEIKNNTNRSVNFETANLQRTANIASAQIAKIKYLLKSSYAEKLTRPLLEISKLRISYPYLSLDALAKLTRPKVSKSAVNNRLNKLMQLYEAFREQNANAERFSE